MSTWFSSFLPSLPSIPAQRLIPDSIQLKLLSFFIRYGLRLSRRHPQKYHIERHIMKGLLFLNNVAISDTILNTLFLPVSQDFRFQTGSIKKLVVNTIWPNPLDHDIDFEVDSLDVTFTLPPELWENQSPVPINLEEELAKVVITISQAFINKELGEHQRQTLRDVFYPKASEASPEETILQGVTMFASLIDFLLLKSAFTLKNTRLAFHIPGYVTWVARVAQITYSKGIDNELDGHLVISDFRLSLANVETTSPSSFVSSPIPAPIPPRPISPSVASFDTKTYVSESVVFALPRKSSVGPDGPEKKTLSIGDDSEAPEAAGIVERGVEQIVGRPTIPPFLPETEQSTTLQPPKIQKSTSSQQYREGELPLFTLTGDDISITISKPTKTSQPKVGLRTGVVLATLYAKQFNKAFELVRAYQPQGVAAVNLDINAFVVGSVILDIRDS